MVEFLPKDGLLRLGSKKRIDNVPFNGFSA
jgi:hypothetical protein